MNYWIECYDPTQFQRLLPDTNLEDWLYWADRDQKIGQDRWRQTPFAFIRRVR